MEDSVQYVGAGQLVALALGRQRMGLSGAQFPASSGNQQRSPEGGRGDGGSLAAGSVHPAPYSLLVFLLRHLQAEGLQHPPQLLRLHPARAADVQEPEGFDDCFRVSENLVQKGGFGEQSRDPVLKPKMVTQNV